MGRACRNTGATSPALPTPLFRKPAPRSLPASPRLRRNARQSRHLPQVPRHAAASTQKPIVGSTQAALPTATLAPTSIPTPQPTYYPPKTAADLHGLAAKGTISAIYEVHSESVGAVGACPQPKREVTVDPSITGQQLAEDLLAYFYGQQLDSPCGSIVFAYHNQAERIMIDVTDSSGAANFDQNGSNLKYTLTLDIGGSLTSKEYVVTY